MNHVKLVIAINGIALSGNSICDFASKIVVNKFGYTAKNVDLTYNYSGILVKSNFTGQLRINHYSNNGEKINFEYNTYALKCEKHNGDVTIENARIVYNKWAIYTFGNMTIENINGAFNKKGIVNYGGEINSSNAKWYGNESNYMENGIYNFSGTINLTGGTIKYNEIGIFNSGKLNILGCKITHNTNYDIYNDVKDIQNGGLTIERNDEVSYKIYLAQDDNFIDVGEYLPTFLSITVANKFCNRKIIKCATENNSKIMAEQINVINKEDYNYYAILENNEYYVILNNQKKIAVVNYYDSISKIISAKYWFNKDSDIFTGEGIEFFDGQEFEEYGYYKVIVINENGLINEKKFILNANVTN